MTTRSRSRGSVLERFWRHVRKTETCWLWTGALKDGYGRLSLGGRDQGYVRAHRFSYEAFAGPIVPGLDLDHLCRNRACVNPDHLEPVTRRENTLRSPIAITAKKAAQTHCGRGHELTEENVYRAHGRRYCRECKRFRDRNRTFQQLARHMAGQHPEYVAEAQS